MTAKIFIAIVGVFVLLGIGVFVLHHDHPSPQPPTPLPSLKNPPPPAEPSPPPANSPLPPPPSQAYACNRTTGLASPLDVCSPANPCTKGVTIGQGKILQNQIVKNPGEVPICKLGKRISWKDPQGLERYSCVYQPANASLRLPLILYFHGTGGNANNVFQYTSLVDKAGFFTLSADAARKGFVIVSVQGRNLHWPTIHADGSHYDYYFRDTATDSKNPDVNYADHLIDTLVEQGVIDQNQIYVMGWSNGATFSQFYAIARHQTPTPRGNRVAAAAVFAFADPFNNINHNQTPSCAIPYPKTIVPLYLLNRSSDALTACNTAQEKYFDLPPGHSVVDWVETLKTIMGNSNVVLQLIDGQGKAVNACSSVYIKGFSLLNHLSWPNGRNDRGGVDWEPSMLEFLKSHPIQPPKVLINQPPRHFSGAIVR